MTEQSIMIPRLPDRSIIDCFKKIGNQYDENLISVNIGAVQIGNIYLDKDDENLKELESLDSTLLTNCNIAVLGLNIAYYRGGRPNAQSSKTSPIYDEIVISGEYQNDVDVNKKRIHLNKLIQDELKAFLPGRIVEGGLSEEQNQLLAIHEGTLERLEKLNEDLIQKSAEFREQIEKRFEEKTVELEKKTQEKQDKVDEKYAKDKEKTDAKEKELEEKLKSIDDRDNTHVRREIRDKMLDDVKRRISDFGVSKATGRKRIPVLIGILLLMLFSLALLIFTAIEIRDNEYHYAEKMDSANPEKIKPASFQLTKIYWLWVRFTLFAFSLLGTVIYYMKWQNKWAEHHSVSEFHLQQFYLDVNRSNWAIESCLEWNKVIESDIPKELLKSITRNLFVAENGELEPVIHPADQLASALMGSASKLNLNLNGNKLEIDKPGKMAKKATPKTENKTV